MLLTFKHELNLLDATDGYISEELQDELAKLKSCDREIEITVNYSEGEWSTEKLSSDYAMEIINDLFKSINGFSVTAIICFCTEINSSLKEGLTANIQHFIDHELPEKVVNSDDGDDIDRAYDQMRDERDEEN